MHDLGKSFYQSIAVLIVNVAIANVPQFGFTEEKQYRHRVAFVLLHSEDLL